MGHGYRGSCCRGDSSSEACGGGAKLSEASELTPDQIVSGTEEGSPESGPVHLLSPPRVVEEFRAGSRRCFERKFKLGCDARLGGKCHPQKLAGQRQTWRDIGQKETVETWAAGPAVQRSAQPCGHVWHKKDLDLGHAPCLQELWKNDVSLDASSVDFLMSDGEEDGSFLSLPTSAFPRRPSLSSELNETSPPTQHLLIQKVSWSCLWTSANTLQEKVCEFQARLRSEEVTRQLLIQQLQQTQREKLQWIHLKTLLLRSTATVEELEEKLLDQTQEVERLRSELGATDLEKQLERLVVENQRLKQELKTCKSSDPASENCPICPHSQNAETLQREVSRWENQARQRERRLAELERDLQEKSQKVESLHRELDQTTRQLQESERTQSQAERKLSLRIQECEEELHRQATAPPRVKYVTQTVEVQSADSQKVLSELQGKNSALQEQVSVQRQLLRELETQLHDSQRTCTQLRTQILVYEGEMERAQGRLEAEMQNLEDEKNRMIEEAFIRAESEMKAVHQNLAAFKGSGGSADELTESAAALRTLTSDYNSLKKQVQEFPFMLEKAIAEAKQEICQVIGEVSNTNQELLRKYKREMNLRKEMPQRTGPTQR
ncbi:hypothetical protein WMY93_013076 [Mugilogobius chulae]|uniref:Uncharacterized protein n=1 Tax=Mugilogobius chulae TaxID=88201 RepID=A0AAW0P2N0_9GOBI